MIRAQGFGNIRNMDNAQGMTPSAHQDQTQPLLITGALSDPAKMIALEKIYEDALSESMILAKLGKPFYYYKSRHFFNERALFNVKSHLHSLYTDTRGFILLTKLLLEVKNLSANNPALVKEVLNKTSDPLLQGLITELAFKGGFSNCDATEFAKSFDAREFLHRLRFPALTRGIITLRILNRQPEKIDLLTENSWYSPEDLFKSENSRSKKAPIRKKIEAVDIKVAEEALQIISPHLLEALKRYSDGLETYRATLVAERAGPYILPKAICFRFTDVFRTDTQLLDSVIPNEVKKELCETLWTLLRLRIALMREENLGEMEVLKHPASKFRLSATQYKTIEESVHNFACNQFFIPWQRSGGETIPRPFLAANILKLRAVPGLNSEGEKQLTIDIRGAKTIFYLNTPAKNSTRYLPFCAKMLQDWHSAAVLLAKV